MTEDTIETAEPGPATIVPKGERTEVRLERFIEHDRDTVWAMLTRADCLPNWLAPGAMDLRVGGRVEIDFVDSGTVIDSTIRECDPPRLLAYSWSHGDEPERPLYWELEAVAGGTHLILILQMPAGEDVAKAAAGWDSHLEMLLAALEGVPTRFPVDHFLAARTAYRTNLAS